MLIIEFFDDKTYLIGKIDYIVKHQGYISIKQLEGLAVNSRQNYMVYEVKSETIDIPSKVLPIRGVIEEKIMREFFDREVIAYHESGYIYLLTDEIDFLKNILQILQENGEIGAYDINFVLFKINKIINPDCECFERYTLKRIADIINIIYNVSFDFGEVECVNGIIQNISDK